MSNDTTFTVRGNLAFDPELKFSQDGKPWLRLRVGHTPTRLNKQTNNWDDLAPMFFNVTLFGREAENAAASLFKGAQVFVAGKLEREIYKTKEGADGESWNIVNATLSASLQFATVAITKNAPGGGGGAGYTQQSPQAQQPPWAQPQAQQAPQGWPQQQNTGQQAPPPQGWAQSPGQTFNPNEPF